jgi:microcystin-dependent protein
MALKNGRQSSDLQTILVGSVIPAGTIAPFAGGTVPTGWLLCDGSTISRSTYSALFAAVGTAHGQGNGSTTFHLPDYRGRFLRGADDMGTGAAGRDPNAATRTAPNTGGATGAGVGSVQDSENRIHTHFTIVTQGQINNTSVNTTFPIANDGLQAGGNYAYRLGSGSSVANAAPSAPSGNTSETRPQNANVEYIIKV